MVVRSAIDLVAVSAAVLAASLAAILAASPARAHDAWADGSPVPAWIKDACCGPDDVHHLDPGQVHRVDGGYRIDGYPWVIPGGRLLPSRDGDWWAFYRIGEGGEYTSVYCFFGPMGY